MVPWWVSVVMLGLFVVPAASACVPDSKDVATQISLDFEHPEACTRATPEGCPALPQADEPFTLDGAISWSWTLDACSSNFVPSASPVHVSFESVERHNHGWLTVTTEPRELFIPVQDQWDVTNDDIDPATGNYRAQQQYPLKVIVSLVGEPSPEALQDLQSTGAASLILKASTEQTTAFQQSFATESFLFDGRAEAAQLHSKDASSLSPMLLLLGLAAVALARHKRA